MDYIRANVRSFHLQIDIPRGAATAYSILIVKFLKTRDEGDLRNRAAQISMYSSNAVLVFSSLMSFLNMRSLNRSIVTLGGAPPRAADPLHHGRVPRLKNPLALIQGYVEAITDVFAGDPELRKRYASIVQDKCR
jgi:hypothetical protein